MTAWRSRELNANGNRPLVFSKEKGVAGSELKVPCHQCIGCRIEHGSGWSVRIMQEAKFHDVNSFLTMTYDEQHVPKNGSINKRDVQLFWKRVRKEFPDTYIRHYSVGEYGEKTGRPHYHAIVFGLGFLQDRKQHSKNSKGDILYSSPTLDRLWSKGACYIGTVTPQSAGYVAGYAFKKINGNRADEHYRRVDPATGETWMLQKEFALMSNRPGIGYQHYERYGEQMFTRGSCIMRGREVPIPKYYDRKLKEVDPVRLEAIKEDRKREALKHKDDQTPSRLDARRAVLEAKRKEHLNKFL